MAQHFKNLKLGSVKHAFNPSTQKAEGQVISVTEFKASLLYIVNCRPARVKK